MLVDVDMLPSVATPLLSPDICRAMPHTPQRHPATLFTAAYWRHVQRRSSVATCLAIRPPRQTGIGLPASVTIFSRRVAAKIIERERYGVFRHYAPAAHAPQMQAARCPP